MARSQAPYRRAPRRPVQLGHRRGGGAPGDPAPPPVGLCQEAVALRPGLAAAPRRSGHGRPGHVSLPWRKRPLKTPALASRQFERILLIKPSAFGDVLHAPPVLV